MRKSAIRLAVAGALLVGASGAAQANFKGIAVNEISEFTFTSISGGALNFNPGAVITSSSFAQWGEGPGAVQSRAAQGAGNPPTADPEMADCGPAGCDVLLPAANFENSGGNLGDGDAVNDQIAGTPPFAAQPYAGQAWARGDAVVVNGDILTGGQAANVAEVVSGPGINTPFPVEARGVNSLNGTFQLNAAAVLQFDFLASTFLEVWTPLAGGKDNSNVEADIEFNITIAQQNPPTGTAATVFNWAPDGDPGAGIVGGTELLDPFSLNIGLFSQNGIGNQIINNALLGEFNNRFRATLNLGPGQYTLTITMREGAEGQQRVPVPATLALLGAGLFGIGAVRLRRAKA